MQVYFRTRGTVWRSSKKETKLGKYNGLPCVRMATMKKERTLAVIIIIAATWQWSLVRLDVDVRRGGAAKQAVYLQVGGLTAQL